MKIKYKNFFMWLGKVYIAQQLLKSSGATYIVEGNRWQYG